VVEPTQCSRCGAVTVDRAQAQNRLSDYLKREGGLGDEEAGRRAGEIVGLIGGGTLAFGLGATSALTSGWWLFLLRGILAVLFGIFALISPLAAFGALVLVFGVWAFIDGIDALAMSISGWRSWQFLVAGLVGIGVGILTFFRPGFTAFALYAAIAAWSIARGILEIAVAIELRKAIKGELWMVLAGITSLLFGVLLILLPAAGVLALAWLIGVYALIFGLMMIALSVRLRGVHKRVDEVRAPHVVTPAAPQPA
jgi:uncharacterized membrane protein HdeD (DUF308 family)